MNQRRSVLSAMLSAPFLLASFSRASSHALEIDGEYASSAMADDWMQGLMGPAAVTGALHVMRFADPYYATTKSISWSSDEARSGLNSVTVPVGFVTDFASIPRIFWSILPRDGSYTYPAVVHDYLYWEQKTSRSDSDEIFDIMMGEFQVPSSARTSIIAAVRAGGGSAWSSNARARSGGERRVVSKLPTDPRVLWKDWKNDSSAYD